jgi:hypothetical protein
VAVHQYSILETAVVDDRTVVGIHILQVGKEEADTAVVSPGEVGIQASAGNGSAVVVFALGLDTSYAEAVVEENTSFVVVGSTYSVEVVG